MNKKRTVVCLLSVMFLCGLSGSGFLSHAYDSGNRDTSEEEERIEPHVGDETKSGESIAQITEEEEKEYANDVSSIADGKIIKKDGTVEYGTPEEGQEYEESHVEQNSEDAEYFDRYAYHPSEYEVRAMASSMTDMTVDIRKRTQWVDASNGNGKITLQYRSDSGTIKGMEDMNVVLIHDKSGSMDVNYGYNLEVVKQGWDGKQGVRWYPVQNSMGWSETVSDIATETEAGYITRITYKEEASGYQGFREGWLHNGEMYYNSPCQTDGHYYLLVKDDVTSNLSEWTMVHGNNLYNIASTDLHHYMLVTDEEARNVYLPAGRRVVRMTQGSYYDENGHPQTVSESNPQYFLDVSQIVQYHGNWILSTCAMGECQMNDRLSKSQDFMSALVTRIQTMNPDSKIAYIPFWGDVPDQGSWSNASSNNTTDGLYEDNAGRMTHKNDVTRLPFTMNGNSIKWQIENPFTYDGTNWARAFENTLEFLNSRSTADQAKKTLIIFLTDGMPQGTAGKPVDVKNSKINGLNEISQLKSTDGVTIYACGVGVNQYDTTGLKERVDFIDSTGTAVLARYTNEFEVLKTTILNRMNSQYVIDIKGQDAFYTDTLNGPFSLDESRLDESWKVLESQGSGMTKGVPTSVYHAAKAGAAHIYVKSTKTVYWYIGNLTNGTYTAVGHEFSFPIKYADYQNVTDGKDRVLESNTAQMLTYVSTQNVNELQTKTMSTPTIIFNRQERQGITINKSVTGSSFTTNQKFRFVYSTKKQSGGKITDYLGEAYVTVKKGSSTGSTVIPNVAPGTYYLYEVDADDNRISPQTGTVTVSEKAAITTVAADNQIPLSAMSSDGVILTNLDNQLKIETEGGSVAFKNEYVNVDVNKVWEDENYAGRPEKVTVWLLRNGTRIKSMELSESNSWKDSFMNLEKYDAKGAVYDYTIEEEEVVGYRTQINRISDNSYQIANILISGSVRIKKLDTDGKTPLCGAVFEVKNQKGKVIAKKNTDTNGEILFEKLYPDTYTITEVKTPEGHTLLKEPLVITVPMQMTAEDVAEKGIDKEQCVYYPESKVYLIYDYTYEITNHAVFQIPMTGGVTTIRTFLPIAGGLVLLTTAMVLLKKNKRNGIFLFK